MKEYKIRFGNQLSVMIWGIIQFAVLIVLQLYHVFYSGYDYINWPIIIFFIVLILPFVYLHLEYYHFNKRALLKIEKIYKTLEYTNGSGETEKIHFEDIEKIKIYMAPSWHRKSYIRYFPIEYYHFASIYTRSGNIIIITCLMAWPVEDVMRTIEGVPIELKKRIFASILMQCWFRRDIGSGIRPE